ncbi:MAG: 8-oxoguanine deaminase [Anaerolineales bacterium]|nr:8-oxoguanine deaminase [Anaerolineales bacterium]
MSTLLVKNATVLVTMDAQRREIAGGGLFARDGVIEQVAATSELPRTADDVVDLQGHVVIPGLVNGHHHLFQSLTRGVPAGQNSDLYGWLDALQPIWLRVTPEALRASTRLGLAELALSGCTTAADHHYLHVNGCRLDDQMEAAHEIGLRFHALRGSVTEPDAAPAGMRETEAAVLADSQRLLETYHDPRRFALVRVGLAPGAIFGSSPRFFRATAELARAYGAHLHTHWAEAQGEVDFLRDVIRLSPEAFLESVGWVGDDVWMAHCIQLTPGEISLFGRAGIGVCHCPNSNARTGAGLAPVPRMLEAGVKVGLGVDGSAANDAGHLLAEARQALLFQRLVHGPTAFTARQALELATLGGARILGRDDIGALEPGRAADFAAWDLGAASFAGAADPVAALIFCHPVNARHVAVHGRWVVKDGQLATADLANVIERHNAQSRAVLGQM